MIRTTVLFPTPLHQRVLFATRQAPKAASQWLHEVIDKTLATRNRVRLRQMYEVLEELDDLGERGITDATTTIDEMLYGESGAWRGNAK